VGLAQGALEEAVRFAGASTIRPPIINFQAIQTLLADMATNLEAARALSMLPPGLSTRNQGFLQRGAMAKLFPTDMAMKVTTDAVQILGGHGYMREYRWKR